MSLAILTLLFQNAVEGSQGTIYHLLDYAVEVNGVHDPNYGIQPGGELKLQVGRGNLVISNDELQISLELDHSTAKYIHPPPGS
jgi:hypothetical protein